MIVTYHLHGFHWQLTKHQFKLNNGDDVAHLGLLIKLIGFLHYD